MKAHSIHMEQRTVYKCSCDREFDDIQKAESHLRNPPQEKLKTPKPRKHAARRRESRTSLAAVEEIPQPTPKRAWISATPDGTESEDGS
jgi:hypothetical protein